jgi:hypothetical protein
VPPVEQYAADYTFTTPKYSQGSYANFFLFVVDKSEKDGLRLDGKALPSNTAYVDIPSTSYVTKFDNRMWYACIVYMYIYCHPTLNITDYFTIFYFN